MKDDPDLVTRQDAVRATPLFRLVSDDEIGVIAARAIIRRFERGETILRQGDEGTSMMVIMQGRVRLSVLSPNGHEVPLGLLGRGEVFGEMALLDGGLRSSNAIGAGDGVLLVIRRADFLPLLEQSPGLCLRLMQVLCTRLRRANVTTEEMVTLDIAGRLGRTLMQLADSHGGRADGRLRIPFRLSQKDLAAMVGASREKVNRALRHWEDEGTLERFDGYWIIARPEALQPTMG